MTAPPFTVLVIGGYGVFGLSICRFLVGDPGTGLVLAGRSRDKADRAVRAILSDHPEARIDALELDKDDGIDAALTATGARLVIDAAGPFQGRDYAVAQACIAGGVHYVDLADARDFVAGFDRLDAQARSAGVLAVSGASSVPGLSSAVVDHLARDLARTDRIAIAIAPGNRAPRGPAVVAAILATVGQPIPRWRGGRLELTHGWQDLRRVRLRLPDGADIGNRWVAACDVPDMALFPEQYENVRSVAFHAGLEIAPLHFSLWALSWPVRWGWVRSLAPLAPLAFRIAEALKPLGSDRGGMVVEVAGETAAGRPVRRRWTLIAGSGHGPQIPGVPAAILARKLARGMALTGAMPCLGLFDLEAFGTAVAGLDIAFGQEELDG